MPLARDLHPEFGYVGSAPRLFRKLCLVIAFMAFGFIAVGSGVTVFMASDPAEPDPMHSLALAPVEALRSAQPTGFAPAGLEQTRVTQSASEQKGDRRDERSRTAAIKPLCRGANTEQAGDCTFIRPMRARPAQAMNERPAIAAVPIGHRDHPAVLPAAEPPIVVAATPPAEEVSANPETPPEATVAPPAPRAATKKARARPQHVQRRVAYAPSRSYGYQARSYQTGGYAGLW